MDDELMDQLREDLDEILGDGGYAFEHPVGHPDAVLTFLTDVSDEDRRACEAVLQRYGVKYRIE